MRRMGGDLGGSATWRGKGRGRGSRRLVGRPAGKMRREGLHYVYIIGRAFSLSLDGSH